MCSVIVSYRVCDVISLENLLYLFDQDVFLHDQKFRTKIQISQALKELKVK